MKANCRPPVWELVCGLVRQHRQHPETTHTRQCQSEIMPSTMLSKERAIAKLWGGSKVIIGSGRKGQWPEPVSKTLAARRGASSIVGRSIEVVKTEPMLQRTETCNAQVQRFLNQIGILQWEEPLTCSAYACRFSRLQVEGVSA